MQITKSTLNLIADGVTLKYEQDPSKVSIHKASCGSIIVSVNKDDSQSVVICVSRFGFKIKVSISVPNPKFIAAIHGARYGKYDPNPHITSEEEYRSLSFRWGYVYKKLSEIMNKKEKASIDSELAATMKTLDNILNLSSISLEKEVLTGEGS